MKRPEIRRPQLRRPELKMPSVGRSGGVKRPSIKGPALKPPAFLADLYYDLRDRRLLPLVALVVVAIAAVPFLLGNKSEPVLLPPPTGLAAEGESLGSSSHLTVVEATPGLRDYHRRLRDRTATDPFEQRFTGPAGGGGGSSSGDASASSEAPSSSPSSLSEGAASTTGGSTTSVEVSGEGGSSSGGGGSGSNGSGEGGSGGAKPNGHLVIFDYAIDVQIVHSPPAEGGGAQQRQPEPVVKHRILPQTPLPGKKAPVVTYLGPGRKQGDKATGRVLLAVSGDVNSISGQHRCVSSARSGGVCELLEVEPGFPLTFAYGDGGAHYTIKVLSIELVITGRT
jgi:hypothetical protein